MIVGVPSQVEGNPRSGHSPYRYVFVVQKINTSPRSWIQSLPHNRVISRKHLLVKLPGSCLQPRAEFRAILRTRGSAPFTGVTFISPHRRPKPNMTMPRRPKSVPRKKPCTKCGHGMSIHYHKRGTIGGPCWFPGCKCKDFQVSKTVRANHTRCGNEGR